jgi:hypothetical protein
MAIKFVLKQIISGTSAENNPTLKEYIFDENMFTVGSDTANNLVVSEVASEQAVIVREGDFLTLINRADGTRLNEQVLLREAFHTLTDGDEISFGKYIISVFDDALNSTSETAKHQSRQRLKVVKEQTILPVPHTQFQPEKIAEELPTPRSFADILDTMRTEEDSFYFTIIEKDTETERIPLEQAEIPIGASSKGKIAFSIEQISTLYAVARKDWSGILLESQRRNSVYVNDEVVETTRRLRNDDRVCFAAPTKFSLILHEPSSLVALESLLSARVAENGTRFGGLAAANSGATENESALENQNNSLLERRFFNHFSFTEIVTMIIATLIGAVLFFLFFEFMFS